MGYELNQSKDAEPKNSLRTIIYMYILTGHSRLYHHPGKLLILWGKWRNLYTCFGTMSGIKAPGRILYTRLKMKPFKVENIIKFLSDIGLNDIRWLIGIIWQVKERNSSSTTQCDLTWQYYLRYDLECEILECSGESAFYAFFSSVSLLVAIESSNKLAEIHFDVKKGVISLSVYNSPNSFQPAKINQLQGCFTEGCL